MRTTVYQIMAAVCILLFPTACLEERDSLATIDFDHVVAIKGVTANETDATAAHQLYMGDLFSPQPVITFSENVQEEDFVYRWIIGKDTTGRQKNLEWEVTIPNGYKLGQTIPGVLIVRNTDNGLEFRQTFSVIVKTNLSPTYIAVYETAENNVEWISMQGSYPESLTRFFPGVNKLVNGAGNPVRGNFRGAMISTQELTLFTDAAPGYGASVSLLEGDEEADFKADFGQQIAPVKGRIYLGNETNLNFTEVRYCEGGTRYILMNNSLYAFDGANKRTPIFDNETYLKTTNVAQVIASRQFYRFQKLIAVRYQDNTIGCFYTYADDILTIMDNGVPLRLDSICGMFGEGIKTSGSATYKFYITARKGGAFNLYELETKAGATPVIKKVIPLPEAVASTATIWYGSYSQRYGFYVCGNNIYKFDYLNMTAFTPPTTPFKTFPVNYEIIETFLFTTTSTGNIDRCTVAFLYEKTKNTTTIHVFDTTTGETLNEYPDAIPGRGKDFFKR